MSRVEKWKPVVGYEGRYMVSDRGRVLSLGSTTSGRRILSQSTSGSVGYMSVALYRGDGKKTTRTVHTLVLEAFTGAKPEGCVGRHLDGDHLNNRSSNLSWGTQEANMQDAVGHGTVRCGARHGLATLTEQQAREVKYRKDLPVRDLAELYGISVRTAYSIRRGETWKYLV